jgi:hypothetical protein
LNSKRLIAVVTLLIASAGTAHAYRNPEPPPSGVVVHLFGPNGIFSDLPGESAKPSTPGQSTDATTPGSAPAATTGVETSEDPSWHAILDQLFIVGDPNDPPKPASGRPGERQSVPTSN